MSRSRKKTGNKPAKIILKPGQAAARGLSRKSKAKAGRENPPPPALAEMMRSVNMFPARVQRIAGVIDRKAVKHLEEWREKEPYRKNLLPDLGAVALMRWLVVEETPPYWPSSTQIDGLAKASEVETEWLMREVLNQLPPELRQVIGEYPLVAEIAPVVVPALRIRINKRLVSETESYTEIPRAQKEAVKKRQREAADKYDELLDCKNALMRIVEMNTQKQPKTWLGPLYLALTVDGKNKGHLSLPEWLSWCGEVQIIRIRRCPICQNFYWANHTAKQTCGARCSATRQKRIRRSVEYKVKEELARDRREKRGK